jgi:hypothetical protein
VALEILQARLRLGENDLESTLRKHLEFQGDMDLESIRIRPEGVVARGKYEMGWMKVGVELIFLPKAEAGKLRFDLNGLRLVQGVGLPGMLRGLIMDLVTELLKDMPGVVVDNETIWVDPVAAALTWGFDVRMNLTGVVAESGFLELIAG